MLFESGNAFFMKKLRRNKQVEQMDGISKSSLIRYKNSRKYYDSGTRVTYGTSARNTGK